MSKSKRKIDTSQLSIFEYLRNLSATASATLSSEGQYKIVDRLRASLRAAIKNSPLSIHQIAGEMSHLVGETITAEKIYSWTRESDDANGHPRRYIPAEYLPAFCHVTESNEPLAIMGQMVGLFVMPGPEALRAEIQKLNEEIGAAQKKKRRRLAFLHELEGMR